MMCRTLCAAASAVLLVGSVTVAQAIPDDDGAVRLNPPRSGHAATLLAGDYVLISGGSGEDMELATVEVVDPVAGSVEVLSELATARTGHTATLLPDGYVLIAGGVGAGSALAGAELYDPLAGLSEPLAPMLWARSGHDAVMLSDGRVLLVGGTDGEEPVARAEIYDPVERTFSKAAKSKAVHVDPAVALLPDGRVLVAGMTASTKKKAKPAEVYDPVKGKWVTVKKARDMRSGHTATVLSDGRVVLLGGTEGDEKVGQILVFDPASASFAAIGELVQPRTGHTATLAPGGQVLVLGGSSATSIESFEPQSGSSVVVGDTGTPRTGHTATALDDGRVLVAGGRFITQALDDLLVYDPGTASLLPLGDATITTETIEQAPDGRTRAGIRAEHGPPEAFAVFYFDEVAADGSVRAVSMEDWTYFSEGVEFTFADDQLVAEDSAELVSPAAEPVPYDPDQFSAYMSLEEVVAATGLEEYAGGPTDDFVEGGELYFADRLMWGMKDGELRFVEAVALDAGDDSPEAE